VVKEVPPGATVVGIPARIIKMADDAHRYTGEKREFVPYGVGDDEQRIEPVLAHGPQEPIFIEPELKIEPPPEIVKPREVAPPVISERYLEIDSRIDNVLSQITELEEKLGEQHAANEIKIGEAASDATNAKISSQKA
jgi:hypothetical protein